MICKVNIALASVPVNILPLIDDTDFKTRKTAIAYNAAGMDLVWNFVTIAGVMTQVAVTPTTAGVYDWTNLGDGMYAIEIPASGGAGINNNVEGFGWFTGVATGVLPWRGPIIQFSPAVIAGGLVDGSVKLPANAEQIGGTTQTGRDIGASVLLSPGSGAGQVDLSSGKVLLQASQPGVTIPTVTNLTNAPTIGDLTATMKASVTTAATAATPIAASVAGDVGGKVLGGGSSAITGIGARAVDGSGNAIAPASATADIQSRIPSALVAGRMDSHIGAVLDGVLTAGKFAADYFVSIITAVWTTAASRTLSAFGFHVQLATTQDQYAPSKAGDAMTLEAAYDAAKTAASQTGVNAAVAPLALQATLVLVPGATATAITADHGAGSYQRNTEPTMPPTAEQIADTLLDLDDALYPGVTLRKQMRAAFVNDTCKRLGAITGGSGIFILRDPADTKDVLRIPYDANGNTTGPIVLDLD